MSRILVVLVAVELVAVMFVGWMLGPGFDDRFIPGVWVWDVSLGGMTMDQAAGSLASSLPLHQPDIVLLGPEGQKWSFAPADLGMSVDVPATLAKAYEPGHGSRGAAAISDRLGLMLDGRQVGPVLDWDEDAALRALSSIASDLARPTQDASVRLDGPQVVLMPGSVGRRVEITPTLEAIVPHLFALEPSETVVQVTDVPPEISDAQAQQAITVADKILKTPLTLLVPTPSEGDPGPWTVDPDVLSKMLAIQISGDGVDVTLDEAALAQFLGPLALALYREPKDAQFDFDMDTLTLHVITPSVTGREVDVAASVARINEMVQAGEHMIPLVVNEIPPEIGDDVTAEDLGIRELVATGESYFTGSSSARDRNIRLGASRFDGVLVKPGEIFSFNDNLGEVTADAGYDESYVIIGDRTVPGVGGGICQVATTAFRAAFYGGYPIVERWPHAYRVSYYEIGGFGPGFDATIYSPLVDFRFKNDTPYYILIHTEVDTADSRLKFLFYSTKDGRTVEQIGPTWGDPIPPGPPVYEYDETMAAGSVVKLESAHDGLDATLGRIVRDADGNVLTQDTFVSNFVPWSARYKFGPGYTPPEGAKVIGMPEP